MKIRIQTLSFIAALAFGMICWGSTLNAQNAPSTSPDRQAQQPSSPDTAPPQSTPDTQAPSSQPPSSQTPDTTAPPPSSRTPESGAQGSASDSGAAGTQTFSGTVVKQGDKYVLKDDSGKTYDIDHQDEVKKFEGKRVRVQGTLDASTNKIMVK